MKVTPAPNDSSPSFDTTLSLAMIVKDEAENLEKCLATARPHVDEIVVIDTGSTDGTQAIARRYADVFEEIEWPDSFSVARNYSFDLASGDYILWLDGDEHIPEAEHWNLLRQVLDEQKFGGLQLRFHNALPDRQVLKADCLWLTRVVRNDPRIRFEGRVHNQIDHNLKAYCKREEEPLGQVPVKVIHSGYALTKEELTEKYQDRIPLLEHEVEQANSAKKESYYLYQLGNAHYMLGQYEEATQAIERIAFEHLAPFNAYYTRLMGANAYVGLGEMQKAMEQVNAMLTLDEDEPIGYMLAGKVLIGLEQFQDALLMHMEAYEKNSSSNNVRFELDESILFRRIGDLAAKLGYLERAQFFYQQYLERYPDEEEVQRVLEKVEDVLAKRATAG